MFKWLKYCLSFSECCAESKYDVYMNIPGYMVMITEVPSTDLNWKDDSYPIWATDDESHTCKVACDLGKWELLISTIKTGGVLEWNTSVQTPVNLHNFFLSSTDDAPSNLIYVSNTIQKHS